MSREAIPDGGTFEAAESAAEDGDALVLELDGFEGPLHLLLALARSQKVDLARLSVAALADQYLAFVNAARRGRFALAADYLVMAAWLAYLKSRLLLPRPARPVEDGPPPEALAEALARRLAKLQAMREAVAALRALPQTGRDVFTRSDPEALALGPPPRLEGDLYALMAAYVGVRGRGAGRVYRAAPQVEAYPLEEARERLRALLPRLADWAPLSRLTPNGGLGGGRAGGPSRASYAASTFAAGLEMSKDGLLELSQGQAFEELYLRACALDGSP